jgi:hypothetical protein
MSESTVPKDAFSEKTKLLNLALKYTEGDMERAKLMVSGQYNDVKIIKGTFDIKEPNVFGLLIIFINIPNRYVTHIDSFMQANQNVIAKASIFDSWKAFYTDMTNFTKKENNTIPSHEFTKYIVGSFENSNIYSELESDNLENLTGILTEIINKFYPNSLANCKVNTDNTNSITMELANIHIDEHIKITDKESEKLDGNYSEKIAAIESKAEYVLNGRIIISPIKGKHISEIKAGEKIKILLTSSDSINKQVAKSLKALSEDNEILPISMRITEKFPMEKKGYYIYGLIAKNVLVRIIEEEDVKIETDTIQKITKSTKHEKSSTDNRTIIYIVLLIGLLFIILFLIIIIL